MSMNENGVTETGARKGKPSRFALHPIHEAAMRIADLGRGLPKSKTPKSRTRDLVTLLLSHGARAWRSSQPRVKIHIHVACERGRQPLHLRLD